MAEMSVIWLRVAAALYSLGLVHSILTLVRRREHLFRVALGAFGIGAVFHFVSISRKALITDAPSRILRDPSGVRPLGPVSSTGGHSWRACLRLSLS
jgi:hypothetical protein